MLSANIFIEPPWYDDVFDAETIRKTFFGVKPTACTHAGPPFSSGGYLNAIISNILTPKTLPNYQYHDVDNHFYIYNKIHL